MSLLSFRDTAPQQGRVGSPDDVLTPILDAVPVPSVPLRERAMPADHGRSGWPGQPA